MKRVIHHLRKQPEHIRYRVLHILVGIAAVILLFFWIYSLKVNFSNPDTQAEIQNDLKPFSALKSNITGGYQNILKPGQNTAENN